MKRIKRSLGMLLAGTLAAAGAALVVAPAAQAAPIGTLTFSPTSGTAQTPITITTNTGCTDANSTNFVVRISGGSVGATPININGNNALTSISATAQQAGPMSVPFAKILDQFRSDAGLPSLDVGTYTVEFVCRTAFVSASLGEFVGTFNITAAMTASSNGAYTVPAVVVATTTTVTGAPVSPVTTAQAVTFTATVTATSGTPTGAVQFKDGSTNLGSPVTVNASGVAVSAATTLSAGAHTITAAFTGTGSFGPSSGTVAYSVTQAAATGTTTTLNSVTPNSGPAFQNVALSATVTPSGTAGTVQFLDGSTLLGSVPNAAGAVTFSTTGLGQGAHSLTAKFVPTDATSFTGSQSAPISATFTAAQCPGCTDPQTVTVNVPAGTLVISTPYDGSDAAHTFALGDLVLAPDGTAYSVSKPFGTAADPTKGVTITDTRAANPGWNASISAGDFVNGASDTIDSTHLGFEGVTPAYITPNAISAGNPITVADILANSPGVKGVGHIFAAATAGHGTGSVYVIGNLTLKNVPTSTHPGLYTATVTFTIA